MATVLALVQAACGHIGITPIPSSIVSTTDPVQIQLRNLLYSTTRHLRSHKIWPQCKRTYSFTTTDDRVKYPLPRDFYSFMPATQYNQTQDRRLNGPVSDAQMNAALYGLATGSVSEMAYRIFGMDGNPATSGGQFNIDPDPGSTTQTLSFDYISKTMFLPKHWIASTAYVSGVYVNASGNVYLNDTNGTSAATPPTAQTDNVTDGTTRWDYQSDPYEGIILDTDLCLFDDDIVINGVIWRYNEIKGYEYAKIFQEYTQMINNAQARWQGSFVGRMDMPAGLSRPRYTTPAGGWSF